jgi:heme-degrading monooxygenase HmoA
MLKAPTLTIIVLAFVVCTQLFAADRNMNNSKPVSEIVKWKSKPGVSDEAMIAAVNAMMADLESLNGFLHQSLYKNSDNEWIDIYYWKTEHDAHASNTEMADKESFKNLIVLIEPDSISIEVMHELQASGQILFD